MKNDNKKSLPKVTKNEVLAWILAGLMIFWTIASVFGIIGFSKSCAKDEEVISASALTVAQIDSANYRLMKIPAGTTFVDYFEMIGNFDDFLDRSVMPALLDFDNTEHIGNGNYYNVSFTYDDYYVNYADAMLFSERPDSYSSEVTLLRDYYLSVFEPIEGVATVDINITFPDAVGWGAYNMQLQAFDVVVEFIKFDEYAQAGSYEKGYTIGFAEGVASANDYSFLSLISSVLDAPIQAFTGLFNFDLLGVNLANFFYAIFTVCIILAVIRVVL